MSPKRQKRAKKKPRRPPTASRTRRLLAALRRQRGWLLLPLLAAIVALLSLIAPFWRLSSQFAAAPRKQPSRLYARPPVVRLGERIAITSFVETLRQRGYRPTEVAGGLGWGRFLRHEDEVEVHLRSFPTRSGWTRPARLEVSFRRGRVEGLRLEGETIPAVWLDPLLLTSYYSDQRNDRWPERLDNLPRYVIHAVLAAEDASFFRHPGLSVSGIARALFVNLRGGRIQQGGSTLTQQLVKNLYLTPERSFGRKAREAVLAVLLELRYDKREILQAYLNEVYLGHARSLNLIGFGAASRAYFGVPASELTLGEAALLAGAIRYPAGLAPSTHPEQARARRDEVLRRMAQLGWLEPTALEAALGEEVVVREGFAARRRARFAADAAATEAQRRFGVDVLADRGYVLLSSLDAEDQGAAEEAVAEELAALEEQLPSSPAGQLEGLLVSVEPRSGRLLAWVGGRDYGSSQFDRIRFAKRQPGSAFKPVVLAAAFAERVALPSTLLVDEPITVHQGRQVWSPKNDDRQFHGVVSVRETIERSLNVPTVRLALDVGLEKIIAWARRLGIESRLGRVPSLALGAFEVAPLELLQVYVSLASGGTSPQLHLLEAVLSREGAALEGEGADAPPERVLEPGAAFMVTSVLEGVTERGTARRLRRDGLADVLATKTGTSSGGRDSWFIGYSPERVTLVWVGYDDNRRARLSGSRAALPIGGRFLRERRPPGGYGVALSPRDVATSTVDPTTGLLATGWCPSAVTEVFFSGSLPAELCDIHRLRDRDSRRRRGDRRGRTRRRSP